MMNYHRDNKTNSYTRTVQSVIIALCVCLLIILGAPLLAPAVGSLDRYSASGERAIISQFSSSHNEFGASCETVSSEYASAYIISRPPSIPYDILALSKGSEEGIQEGDYVGVMHNGQVSVIGSVHAVFPKTAQVVLFSSPDTSHSVVHMPSNTTLSLLGKGGGEFALDVPRDMQIDVGDVFSDAVTRLPVATVVSLRRDERDPLQTIYAQLPLSLAKIQCVVVWHSPIQ